MVEKKGKTAPEGKISVEKSLEKLEQIVARLEGGEVDLDESFKVFEKAVKISRKLRAQLDSYEQKIETITADADSEKS